MKERIEEKVNEVIEYIISKKPEDISFNEYRILDWKLQAIKYEKDQQEHNQKMAEMTAQIFNGSFSKPPMMLPDSQ